MTRFDVTQMFAKWVWLFRKAMRRHYHKVRPFAGLGHLDRRLIEHLPSQPGVFVEAGANDGVSQSNTYALERRFGWEGLLIEPLPKLAEWARKTRKKSIVLQTCLVTPTQAGQVVLLRDLDLMTSVVQDHPVTADLRCPPADVRMLERTVQCIGRNTLICD